MAPDEEGLCEQIVGYLVAHAVSLTKVELLSFVAMSNHYHGGDTDVEARHGKFMSVLNGLLARAFNSVLDRDDHLWDAREPKVQKIVGLEAHIDQFLYVALNPVAAGLVPTAAEWPGFIVTPDMIGKTLTFRRPDIAFFRTDKYRSMPEEIELHIHEPPGAEEVYGPGGYAKEVARRLAEREREIQRERAGDDADSAVSPEEQPPKAVTSRRAGTMRGLFGASARETVADEIDVEAISHEVDIESGASPRHRPGEPMPGFVGLNKLFETDRFAPTPRPEGHGRFNQIICYDPDRLRFELAALEQFRVEYRDARAALLAGRTAIFPPGTYSLHHYYGVKVGPPPDDEERFVRALSVDAQMDLRAAA